MKKHLAVVFVLGFCVATVLGQKSDWKEYEYVDDGFAISAPSKPSLQNKLMDTPVGRAQVHIYSITLGGDTVIIYITEYGKDTKISPVEALQRAKNALPQSANSKLVAEKEISLDNNPGIEFEVESPTFHALGRYYAAENRLVNLVALSDHGEPSPPGTTRIFDSLRLLKQQK